MDQFVDGRMPTGRDALVEAMKASGLAEGVAEDAMPRWVMTTDHGDRREIVTQILSRGARTVGCGLGGDLLRPGSGGGSGHRQVTRVEGVIGRGGASSDPCSARCASPETLQAANYCAGRPGAIAPRTLTRRRWPGLQARGRHIPPRASGPWHAWA